MQLHNPTIISALYSLYSHLIFTVPRDTIATVVYLRRLLKGCISQANNTQLTRKEREMWNITTKALLHLGVILVVDVFFHYLYILTIPSDMKLVTKLSDCCLGE